MCLNSVPFRIKFPKSYTSAADGKRYPALVFFHGLGEAGNVYDNEYSMANGGPIFLSAVDNGQFDGFIIIPQSTTGWTTNHYAVVKMILDYMIANNKLDPFGISDNGLSAGGNATWDFMVNYPTYIAHALPMSGCSIANAQASYIDKYKFTPVWHFQGGLDKNPDPNTTNQVKAAVDAAGGQFKTTLYPTLGHGTWSTAWAEPDFFPSCVRAYSANPWPLFGRTEFCPGDPISVTIGCAPGFSSYQWRKDGVIIPGATSNTIVATSTGTYDARLTTSAGVVSEWSRVPVVIKIKTATITPPITVSGLMSKVIPSLETNNVILKVPTGYVSYVWQKTGNPTTLSTDSTLTVTAPGDYIVKVTEQYGCSSSFGTPFTVVDANGANKPSPAANLTVSTLSKTSLRLDWSDNPTPQFNETNYEIYQASQPGGPYKLAVITGADITTANITGLEANKKYYYKARAVNASGAAAASNEAFGTTDADTQAPTAPGNLIVTLTTRTSISLSWTASTDDVGVERYDVYVNGQKSYTTTATSFTVNGLTNGVNYVLTVKAKDAADNVSPASNQVSAQPILNGLNYRYYTFVGNWTALPDFNTLTPITTGVMPNVAITPRTQDDNFAFLWEGSIKITQAGNYFFRTNSDDGSRLWLGTLNGTTSPYSYSGTPLVNNDGLHGTQNATSASVALSVGTYPIAMAFFEQGGGEAMTVTYRTPSSGSSYISIPNANLADAPVNNGSAPADPSNPVATAISYKSINLTWTDNSNNETGFEIYRSTSPATGYNTVGVVSANATSYTDTTLTGSTTYYYKVKAIGQFGQSNAVGNVGAGIQALWELNNNYIDSSGNGLTLTAGNSPTFDAADFKEGTYSMKLNGTSQYVTIPNTGSFLQDAYTAKTLSFWMKSSANTGNRVIADLGGSDDGLALRLDANTLYAGVASNNVRVSISTPYSSAGWNYITLVYNGNALTLYVNGVQAATNTNLGFSAMTTTTNGARLGTVNGTNAFNNYSGFFSGWLDNVSIYGRALSVSEITTLMNNGTLPQSFATTLPMPATPATPTNLVATGASTSSVNITWNDVASNETGYELYKSNNNNSNYILLAKLPAGTTSYLNDGLFANSVYYYKVRAMGIGGNSVFSNEDSAISKNNIPVITAIPNQQIHYQSVVELNIQATDSDAEYLTISVPNLPAFASFQQSASGIGKITFNPSGTQGTFNGIIVNVSDQHGGSGSTSFNLIVNDNFNPTITAVSNYTLNENTSLNINLSAQDQNTADVLTWSVSNLPDNYTLTPGANGSATLALAPGYAAAGVYAVNVTVSDGKGGSATSQFNLTVNDVEPSTKIYTRVKYANTIGAPWNNMTGPSTLNLVDENGTVTPVGVVFQQSWWLPYNAGPTTGNNSGVYPDAVLNDFWYFGYYGGPETASLKVTGLSPTAKYGLTFYAGSVFNGFPDNGTTTYTVGNKTVSLYVQNNTTNTVSISDISPAADGTITVNMTKAANTPIGYLNALIISSAYDDGTAPAAAKQFAVVNVPGQGVKLTWQDVAYNETAYEVYRSNSAAGPFSLINSPDANSVTYTDNTVSGGTTYYYQLRAINSHGNSAYTSVLSATTTNRIPQITTISDVQVKNGQTATVNVVATDDASDHITLTATGLPSFASFVDNGNGTGVITLQPAAGVIGVFSGLTITAKDNSDSSRSTSFSVYVTDANISSTYINITADIYPAAAPWNNLDTI